MLTGSFTYNGVTAKIRGYDTPDAVYFEVTGFGLDYGCPGYEDEARSILNVKVGKSTIGVESYKREVNGVDNRFNYEWFTSIGCVVKTLKEYLYIHPVWGYNPLGRTEIPIKDGKIVLFKRSIAEVSYKGLELTEDSKDNLQIPRCSYTNLRITNLLSNDEVDSTLPEPTFEDFYSIDEVKKRTNKNLDWIGKQDYEIVTPDKLEAVCKEILEHDGVIAFDTETTGLNINFCSQHGVENGSDWIVGMVFSIREGQAWYVPVGHRHIENVCEQKDVYITIEKYFKPILETKELIAHNSSFDWKVMWGYGVNCNFVHDTMALYKLTECWDENHKMSLKALTKEFLGRDSLELNDFVPGNWGDEDLDFRDIPYDSVRWYACPDADNTISLYNFAKQERLLEIHGAKRVYQIECLFSRVIGYQEYYGHLVDMKNIDSLKSEVDENIKKYYGLMVEEVGYDFNPRSSKQLQKVLFDDMGIPSLELTKSGARSTSADVLKRLAEETTSDGEVKHPIVEKLLKYREYAQLKSNFLQALNKFATEDGYLFSSVHQFLVTGRLSIHDPNYQSYNDVVKRYIIPRRGYYMCDSDYSSIEYRILASMAGETALVQRFVDPDMDYHTYQASRMFSVPYELVSKKLRSQSKGVNFGLAYGMGLKKLGKSIFGEESPENTQRAAGLFRKYFEGQDNIREFFERAKVAGVSNGYSETYFGRRRHFDSRTTNKNSIERYSTNHRIQGTAADIYKIAMGRLFIEICKRRWIGKVLVSAFVHDECVLEVHNSIDPCEVYRLIKDCIQIPLEGWCPLYIGMGYGRTWYEAKSNEIPVQVQDSIYKNSSLSWWNGDKDRIVEWSINLVNSYMGQRVYDFIRDCNGKVLDPTVNGYAHRIVGIINKGWTPTDEEGFNYSWHTTVKGVQLPIEEDKDPIKNIENLCSGLGWEKIYKESGVKNPLKGSNGVGSESKIIETARKSEEEKVYEAVKSMVDSEGYALIPNSSGMIAKLVVKSIPIPLYGEGLVVEDIEGNKIGVCNLRCASDVAKECRKWK